MRALEGADGGFALHREVHAEGGAEPPALTVLDPLVVAVSHNDTGISPACCAADRPAGRPTRRRRDGAGLAQGRGEVDALGS